MILKVALSWLEIPMYKLTIYIYSNHVPFDASQKSYEFKSLSKFGSFQKKFKIPICRTVFRKSY